MGPGEDTSGPLLQGLFDHRCIGHAQALKVFCLLLCVEGQLAAGEFRDTVAQDVIMPKALGRVQGAVQCLTIVKQPRGYATPPTVPTIPHHCK